MELIKTGLSVTALAVAATAFVSTLLIYPKLRAGSMQQEDTGSVKSESESQETTHLLEKQPEELVKKMEERLRGGEWEEHIRLMEAGINETENRTESNSR